MYKDLGKIKISNEALRELRRYVVRMFTGATEVAQDCDFTPELLSNTELDLRGRIDTIFGEIVDIKDHISAMMTNGFTMQLIVEPTRRHLTVYVSIPTTDWKNRYDVEEEDWINFCFRVDGDWETETDRRKIVNRCISHIVGKLEGASDTEWDLLIYKLYKMVETDF